MRPSSAARSFHRKNTMIELHIKLKLSYQQVMQFIVAVLMLFQG